MYVYVGLLQLITVLGICMYGLCPCACVAYDLIKVMLLYVISLVRMLIKKAHVEHLIVFCIRLCISDMYISM